jgi:hypothetical protein
MATQLYIAMVTTNGQTASPLGASGAAIVGIGCSDSTVLQDATARPLASDRVQALEFTHST